MIRMTFEEAKARPDYRFTFGGIDSENITPEMFRKVMASKDMTPVVRPGWGWLQGDGDGVCMAVLQVGHVDVELFLYYFVEYPGGPEEQNPCIDLFMNVEYTFGWEGDDLIGDPILVDWRLDNWMEQLEREMYRHLVNRANFMDYHIDTLNER